MTPFRSGRPCPATLHRPTGKDDLLHAGQAGNLLRTPTSTILEATVIFVPSCLLEKKGFDESSSSGCALGLASSTLQSRELARLVAGRRLVAICLFRHSGYVLFIGTAVQYSAMKRSLHPYPTCNLVMIPLNGGRTNRSRLMLCTLIRWRLRVARHCTGGQPRATSMLDSRVATIVRIPLRT